MVNVKSHPRRGTNLGAESSAESGQTALEYVVLLAIVVGFFMTLIAGMRTFGLQKRLLLPLQDTFAKTYQYGHPKALGYDDGGPARHPRASQSGNGNFRIFTPLPN